MEEKTIQILRNALSQDPDLWESRQYLAELLCKNGDIQGASDVLGAAPQWPGDEASLEFAAGVFAHTKPDYSTDLYNAVIERNPGNARAHAALARLYMGAGDRENAREHHLAVQAMDPSLIEPRVAQWVDGAGGTAAAAQPPAATQTATATAPPAAQQEPVAPAAVAEPEPEPEPEPQPEPPAADGKAAAPPAAPDRQPADAFPVPDLSKYKVPAPRLATASGPAIGDTFGQFSMAAVEPPTGQAAEQREAQLEKSEKQQRKFSLAVAAIVHVIIGLLLTLWVVSRLEDSPMMVVASDEIDPGPPKVEARSFAKSVRRKPNPASSAARAQVITSNVAAPISVEEIEEIDPDAFGVKNSFGAGLGFGEGDGDGGGGAVMFFGSGANVNRAVFVVDFSGSMSQGSRISQLKKELDSSLSQLPAGIFYRVIYYSHRPWLGGENVGSAPFRDPEDGDDRISWVKATKENIQRSREQVANMRLGGATNWIPPIRMALNMIPPPRVIWLLTDGEATDREEMITQMAEINPGRVRINTIGMEIGGPTFRSLIEIAEMTGGNYSIVMGGELHTGSAARKFTDPKFSPQN